MSDSMLPYYNRELDALRTLGARFAEAHPKVAGRLRLAPGSVDDPHVGRLLEGAAFLSARVQRRLDDELPEITDALLGVLYPHYLAPVPPAAIVQLASQPDLRGPVTIPSGTAVQTDPVKGEPCRFATSYETTLWPIEIEVVRLTGLPLAAPAHPRLQGARSSLRIVLRTTDPDISFAQLGLDRLRVYLQGPMELSLPLYELLCGHTVGAVLANGPNDDRPTLLPPGIVQPVGFDPSEALYPWPARSFSGFRLLTEYFALPEKFLFVEFGGLAARTLVQDSNRLELFLYFDQGRPELERRLQSDSLALGCTPMVNLFRRQCEPIRLDHQRTEYPVVPDTRRPQAFEVWSVEQVRELRDDGSQRPWRPFYRQAGELVEPEPDTGFYNLMRRDSPGAGAGSDVLLAPFDPDLAVDQPADAVLSLDAWCSNRDLAAELPFGGSHPHLHLPDGHSAVVSVTSLTPAGGSLRAPLHEQRSWRLISHLSIGHLSITGGDAAAASLRDVLRLYDLRGSPQTKSAIAALLGVQSRAATARVPGARPGSFCRGLDVTLEFEARSWDDGGMFLFASVLDRFMALHATVNSFIRSSVRLQGRMEIVARFAPRAGTRTLL